MNHLIDIRDVGLPQPWMEALLDDPEVFEGVSGGIVERENFNLGMIPEGGRFFGVFVDENPSGFFTILPGSEKLECEIHTTMGRNARGKVAIDAMTAVLRLLASQGVRHIVSFCYSDKPHTIWFAKKCGFSILLGSPDSRKIPVEICLS